MKLFGLGKEVPPLKEHVIIYFAQKGCPEQIALDFFFYFSQKNWNNHQGKLLSNWKRTAWYWILNNQ
ncbi:MAG: hypothetical protein BGO69_05600 [Bacteroidetes bacterium 46-16]|nr:MAG: hypothetical protein BGO69_05600 [Bacteroidetes bacterium 46-16]